MWLEQRGHPVAGSTQTALEAHLAGDRRALIDHLLRVRHLYGEPGLYLAAVALGRLLRRQVVCLDGRAEREDLWTFRDTIDALRFAMAVQQDDCATALAIWRRFVHDRRPGSLLTSLVGCYRRPESGRSAPPSNGPGNGIQA